MFGIFINPQITLNLYVSVNTGEESEENLSETEPAQPTTSIGACRSRRIVRKIHVSTESIQIQVTDDDKVVKPDTSTLDVMEEISEVCSQIIHVS